MNDLTPISPSTRFSMASTLQSFGDMEGLLEEGDCSPSDQGLDGSNPSLLATGLQTPIDFSIPLEPSLLNSTDFASHDLGPSAAIDIAEIDLRSPKSSPPSRRGTLYSSPDTWVHQTSVQEQDVVVVAREGWSYFKCNPTSARSACPKTAKFHLEGLEQTLRSREAWQHLELLPDFVKPTPNRNVIYTEPFSSFTRDKLLAITQTFLHEASNIHYAKNSATQTVAPTEGRGFIILPPANILEHFLDAYVWRFEPYYPFVNAALLDANNLMRIGDARAASLLLLLMIALGASATPTMEARFLTNGLTEACRISLLDNIEKNSELVEDLTILRCGLLFTTAAVWSGDKWHMDVRSSYLPNFDGQIRS
ncbi:MAG: hypothetical protein LQ342_008445 [Letrouitia transgressa]|nr:MAG: hypothetical protein LQ342_008445 [Letrouitia transgressa]